jgi:hypothetical protein
VSLYVFMSLCQDIISYRASRQCSTRGLAYQSQSWREFACEELLIARVNAEVQLCSSSNVTSTV